MRLYCLHYSATVSAQNRVLKSVVKGLLAPRVRTPWHRSQSSKKDQVVRLHGCTMLQKLHQTSSGIQSRQLRAFWQAKGGVVTGGLTHFVTLNCSVTRTVCRAGLEQALQIACFRPKPTRLRPKTVM